MGRRDREDDDEPIRTRRKKGGIPVWAIALVVAVPLLFITAGCGGYLLLWRAKVNKELTVDSQAGGPGAVQAEEQKKANAIPRREFELMLENKRQAKILELVGKPERTEKSGLMTRWYYKDRTLDPVTGKVDAVTVVEFFNQDRPTNFSY